MTREEFTKNTKVTVNRSTLELVIVFPTKKGSPNKLCRGVFEDSRLSLVPFCTKLSLIKKPEFKKQYLIIGYL